MAGEDAATGLGDGGAGEEAFVSLYRRFRPGKFSELRGQPHVVRALQGAVRDGRVAHAYLFSGPRGTGKTSSARILARALNCADPQDGEPCGRCASCVDIARGASLDVHELDAASNNGVDAMRDLIAHAALGTPGRWKVYIVDEVHMLSTAAANALLKTLEEPPAHVVFVLATTDPQKVPPTIRSRTQHFEFGLLPTETLVELVRDVNAAAGLALDEEALSTVVRRGRGSARDTLSALDQVAASGSAEGIRPEVTPLAEAVAEEDAALALATVARLHEAGWGPQQLATELVDELRQAFLVAFAPDLAGAVGGDVDRLTGQARQMGLPRLVRAIETLGRAQVDMRDAPDPRVVLEVALVRLVRPDLDESASALADRVARLERAVADLGAGRGGTAAPEGAPRSPGAAGAERTAPPTGAAPAASPAPDRSAGEQGTPAPAAAGGRPGLGALRRQRGAAPTEPSPGGAPGAPSAPRRPSTATDGPPDAPGAPSNQDAGDPSSRAAARPSPAAPSAASPPPPPPPAPSSMPSPHSPPPSPAASPPAPSPPASSPPAASPPAAAGTAGGTSSGVLPDRDRLVEAWGDHILRGLPARAKALYSAGRFLRVEGATATFALPNAAHRERCEEVRPAVEQAIGAHFGLPVALELVVDDGSTAATPPAGGSAPVRVGDGPGAALDTGLDPDDDFDPTAAVDANAVTSVAHAKVLEAFPGAEEVSD